MESERMAGFNANQLKNVPNNAPSISSPLSSFTSPNTQLRNPPPVPPRQPVQSYSALGDRSFGTNYYNGYGYAYNSQYRGFNGYGGYSSYGPYSTYSSYGTPGGHRGDVEHRLLQYVEENTRPTFQLIETVLQTFSSMTMLLESTYFALTNSFRAILSVAENIGKLRSTVNQLFSTFALIRFLKWLYKKIVRSAGIKDHDTINEELWDKSLAKIGCENVHTSSYWSGFLIFSVFIVIPYMIHKISSNIKQMQTKGRDIKEWHQCEEPAYIATVLFDFVGSNNDELNAKAGQKICLAPSSLQPKNLPGWCLASDNVHVGLIPYNYVKVIGQLKKLKKDINVTSTNEEKSFACDSTKHGNDTNFETLKSHDNVGK